MSLNIFYLLYVKFPFSMKRISLCANHFSSVTKQHRRKKSYVGKIQWLNCIKSQSHSKTLLPFLYLPNPSQKLLLLCSKPLQNPSPSSPTHNNCLILQINFHYCITPLLAFHWSPFCPCTIEKQMIFLKDKTDHVTDLLARLEEVQLLK